MVYISVAEVDLKVYDLCVCHRHWVNPEQCAVYQQQCCEHHRILGLVVLLCSAQLPTYPCCFSGPPPGTHWYFPNGSRVENALILYHTTELGLMDILSLLLNLGQYFSTVTLRATTTGVFRCEIRDAIGAFQEHLCRDIYCHHR